MRLAFTSCQAPSADTFCDAIVHLIAQRLGIRATFVARLPWQERERRFGRGDLDVCWMCGWTYAEWADEDAGIELVAAPVMIDPRYADRPVYFSDVVVRADSRLETFGDLRGRSWAYNEPHSHSGYSVVRYYLATQGFDTAYFSAIVESGSHAASLERILRGEVDASAIDSTVLASLIRRRPALSRRLRVIESIGPSPAPPWVMRASLPAALREKLRTAFLTLHEHEDGRSLLELAGVKRFAAIADRDYDPIRQMAATWQWPATSHRRSVAS